MPRLISATRYFVIDGGASWVHSLTRALGERADVTMVTTESIGFTRLNKFPTFRFEIRTATRSFNHLRVPVPGWTRMRRLSSAIVAWAIHRLGKRVGPPDVMVYTLPYYASVLPLVRAPVAIYHVFDPFEYYGWDRDEVRRMETQLINRCDGTSAVSRALVADLEKRSKKMVLYLPNATSAQYIEQLATTPGPAPRDIANLPRPIIGCIGNINRTYDWKMLDRLTEAFRDVSFVFVGGSFPDPCPEELRVASKSNVYFLGSKPHHELPAYLQHFDVCLNPLQVGPHNDRRSPLRIYDYLGTDKPIISTAIGEALEHAPHVEIGRTIEELTDLVRRHKDHSTRVDVEGRRAYVAQQTWQARAATLDQFACRLLEERRV